MPKLYQITKLMWPSPDPVMSFKKLKIGDLILDGKLGPLKGPFMVLKKRGAEYPQDAITHIECVGMTITIPLWGYGLVEVI